MIGPGAEDNAKNMKIVIKFFSFKILKKLTKLRLIILELMKLKN